MPSPSGAGFESLKDTWQTRPLARSPSADGAGGLAEFERELVCARTGGRKRAKKRGVRFGRSLKLTPPLTRLAAGEGSSSDLALQTVDSFYRWPHYSFRIQPGNGHSNVFKHLDALFTRVTGSAAARMKRGALG